MESSKDDIMKLGEDEVNTVNGFKLLWKGIKGLSMLILIFGKVAFRFILWFGKIFMRFGDSYSKHMDKRMNKIDKENKKYTKQFKQY